MSSSFVKPCITHAVLFRCTSCLEVEAVPAGAELYFPRSHIMHAALPVTAFQLPMHGLQACPSGPVYPALHLQSAIEPLPVCKMLLVLFGHGMHAALVVWAIALLYLAISHGVHGLDEPWVSL